MIEAKGVLTAAKESYKVLRLNLASGSVSKYALTTARLRVARMDLAWSISVLDVSTSHELVYEARQFDLRGRLCQLFSCSSQHPRSNFQY